MQAEFIPKQIQDQLDVIVTSLDNGSTIVWVGDHYETRPLDFTDLTGTIDLAQFPPGTIVSIDSIDADALYFFDNALFTPRLVGAEEAANFVKPGLDLTFVDISGTLTIDQLPPGTAATVDSIGENALFYYDDGTATPLLKGAADVRTFLGLVVGTNVVAWDADLDALGALSGTHTIYYRSAANTWSSVTIGSGLDFTGATLSATASGSGDASTNTSTSVDSEVALFSGTLGKTLKRATGSGLALLTSGVLSTITNNSSNWDSAFTERRQWDGGATNLVAATGRTSLGLVIGTNVQAWDADLDTWATVTPASGVATFLATPSSANLRSALTDELGTGAALFDGATPSTGLTLTNCTGLPIAGLVASTSTAIGVGSIELGHASDTTLLRVSAGVVSIEGSNILKASNIGGSVQAWDADLDTLAGLTATTDNFIVSVSSAWASRTPSQVKTTLGLVIGTNVQAWDADLDTWAGITPAANVGTFLATPSSANLLAAMTDETGSGACVFATGPTLSNPVVGTQAAGDNSTKAASTAYVDGGSTNHGGWSSVWVVTSDATTTGQSLVDITGLVTPTLSNSTLYEIEGTLNVSSSSVAGIRFGIHGGGTGTAATCQVIYMGVNANADGTAAAFCNCTVDTNSLIVATLGGSTLGAIFFRGFVTTRSTGTATISIQHLKVTSGTSTVKVGSVLRYRLAGV